MEEGLTQKPTVSQIADLCLSVKRQFPRHMRDREGQELIWVDGADFYALLTEVKTLRVALERVEQKREALKNREAFLMECLRVKEVVLAKARARILALEQDLKEWHQSHDMRNT